MFNRPLVSQSLTHRPNTSMSTGVRWDICAAVRWVEYCKCHVFVCAMQAGVSFCMVLNGCGRMTTQTNAVTIHENRMVRRQIMMWLRSDRLNTADMQRMDDFRNDESDWPSNGKRSTHGLILIGYDDHVHWNWCVCVWRWSSDRLNETIQCFSPFDKFSIDRLQSLLSSRCRHNVDFFFNTFFPPQLIWPWRYCANHHPSRCFSFYSCWDWYRRRATDVCQLVRYCLMMIGWFSGTSIVTKDPQYTVSLC